MGLDRPGLAGMVCLYVEVAWQERHGPARMGVERPGRAGRGRDGLGRHGFNNVISKCQRML